MNWQTGTVVGLTHENARTCTIRLQVPQWHGHRPGQHVDIRLTAADGYQAQRSYSIASPPGDEFVEMTVQRLPNGEVSLFLVDQLRIGDAVEFRGPIGGYFVWEEPHGGPLMLVAGGSGIVPFRSILGYHQSIRSKIPVRVLYSARAASELIYREELMRIATLDQIDVSVSLTRAQPVGWRGYARRVDRDMLEEVGWSPTESPLIYLCGPTTFVETAADLLVAAGHDPARIRIERFGGIGLE